MVGKYKVITLCGSTRFKDAFMEAQKRLTLEGNIVISVGLFGHSGDEEVWTEGTKEMLDDMHKRKIDMADEIYVINVGGYIGSSTRSEIEYATAKGMPVRYLEEFEEEETDEGQISSNEKILLDARKTFTSEPSAQMFVFLRSMEMVVEGELQERGGQGLASFVKANLAWYETEIGKLEEQYFEKPTKDLFFLLKAMKKSQTEEKQIADRWNK